MLKLLAFMMLQGSFVALAANKTPVLMDCSAYLIHGIHIQEALRSLRPISLSSGRSLYFRLDAHEEHHQSFDVVHRIWEPRPKKLTVLLHGLGESHISMMGVAERLKENKRDVLLLELPYHGQQFFDLLLRDPSGLKLGSLSYQDTLRDLAEAIERIALDNQYKEIELVGHSLGGGFTAFLIEQINPKIPVRDAFLISPYSEALDVYHLREMAGQILPGGGIFLNMMNIMTPLTVKTLMYELTVLPYLQSQLPAHARRDLKFTDLTEKERGLLRLKTLVIEKTIKGSREMNVSAILSRIPQSTRMHILHPKGDQLLPAKYHEQMLKEMKQAGLSVTYKVLDAGHMAVIEKPGDIGLWILLNSE